MTQGLYTVSESAGSLTICYEILSGRTATRSVSMQFRTVQGEAEGILCTPFNIQVVEFWFVFCFADGDDYTYTYASDSFDDGDSSDCNSVSILSDSIDEEEECFTVSLSTTSSYSGLTINPRIATVCIIDDDRECSHLSCVGYHVFFFQLHQLLLVYRRHHIQCMRQMSIKWCVLRYCLETLLDAVSTLNM